ncbi:MAG: hypothetical protein K6G88_06395 [Lachnospiraceae bacterium]|nr:hypothetical protein [Lachnospiraceae bacterium]
MSTNISSEKIKKIFDIKIIATWIIIILTTGVMIYDFFINNDSFSLKTYTNLTALFIFAFIFQNMFIKSAKIKKRIQDIEQANRMKKKSRIIFAVSIIIATLLYIFFATVMIPKINALFAPVKKPIIYLYPQDDTAVTVSLGNVDNIIVSYPKYTDGWNVLATPNGDLTDLNTGKQLYSLYYENISDYKFSVKQDGFVVSDDDVDEFLDEKLEILGLNYKEREEFIVYWLPVLKANKYNYIRFATTEEIEKNMPLNINPTPDSVIRVIMTFKGLDKPVNVAEQKLTTPKRTGFVAVEWGGTEIK